MMSLCLISAFAIAFLHGIAMKRFPKKHLVHYIIEAIFVFPYTSYNIYVFRQAWSHQDVTKKDHNVEISKLIMLEIGFYIGYLFVDYLRKDREQCLHHSIAFVMLIIGYHSQYHQLILTMLTLMCLSNPLLTISKIVYKLEYWRLSKVTFGMFTLVFITCRCIGYGGVIWFYAMDLQVDRLTYITMSSLSLCLYIMQLVWSQRIIKLLMQ